MSDTPRTDADEVIAFASQLSTDNLDIVCEALIAVVAARRALERNCGYMGDVNGPGCDPDVP